MRRRPEKFLLKVAMATNRMAIPAMIIAKPRTIMNLLSSVIESKLMVPFQAPIPVGSRIEVTIPAIRMKKRPIVKIGFS